MYDFAVIDDQGRYCGGCGINQISKLNRFANLGYWVRSSRAGQGIAVQAVQAVVAWALANTTPNRLEVVVATGNVRSHRVAVKAGAVLDGVLRQRVIVDGQASDAALYSFVRPG
jgi:RimJ/RimL family protein N-acetyltransferase